MKKDKVDKGFELFYDNLSYRRKLIRTILMMIIGILVGVLLIYVFDSILVSVCYWVPFIISGIIQFRDNYKAWKNEKNQ